MRSEGHVTRTGVSWDFRGGGRATYRGKSRGDGWDRYSAAARCAAACCAAAHCAAAHCTAACCAAAHCATTCCTAARCAAACCTTAHCTAACCAAARCTATCCATARCTTARYVAGRYCVSCHRSCTATRSQSLRRGHAMGRCRVSCCQRTTTRRVAIAVTPPRVMLQRAAAHHVVIAFTARRAMALLQTKPKVRKK